MQYIASKMLRISGVIKSGLGEGRLFLSMKQYEEQIVRKLGFAPFEGTLNIQVNEKEKNKFLENADKIIINGFKIGNKSFGFAYCIKAEINGVKGAIIVPEKTRHKDIIEFIAPVNLRKNLKLNDSDRVVIELI